VLALAWVLLASSCPRLASQPQRLSAEATSVQTDLEAHVQREERLAEASRRERERVTAIAEDPTMTVVFQPIVDLSDGRVVGAEALARFEDGRPDEWFAEARRLGLGVQLEVRAAQIALREATQLDDIFITLNVSPETLCSTHLVDALRASPIPMRRLVLEITEHAMVEDYQVIRHQIEDLRALGLRIAVDDVGAGYSSMAHVLHLRPDIVKFDRGLAHDLDQDGLRFALVKALTTFNRHLDAMTVAEGVERQDELDVLRDAGIGAVQGYLVGRPSAPPLGPMGFGPAPTLAA